MVAKYVPFSSTAGAVHANTYITASHVGNKCECRIVSPEGKRNEPFISYLRGAEACDGFEENGDPLGSPANGVQCWKHWLDEMETHVLKKTHGTSQLSKQETSKDVSESWEAECTAEPPRIDGVQPLAAGDRLVKIFPVPPSSAPALNLATLPAPQQTLLTTADVHYGGFEYSLEEAQVEPLGSAVRKVCIVGGKEQAEGVFDHCQDLQEPVLCCKGGDPVVTYAGTETALVKTETKVTKTTVTSIQCWIATSYPAEVAAFYHAEEEREGKRGVCESMEE